MNEQREAVLQAAMKYHEMGLSIIPVGPDKRPLMVWRQYQTIRATPEQIKAWFLQWPDMNIGIVTGPISGIVVVDIENGGSTEGYPPTATVKTANNGWHLYYKHPGKHVKNAVRVRDLTDIRGDGGMVVAPPSVLAGGKTYEWVVPFEDGLADFPFMPEVVKPQSELADWESLKAKDIPEGNRNDTATKEIGRVLHALTTKDWETYGWAGLREWNKSHCVPPMDEKELRATYESIKSKELSKRGSEGNPENSEEVPEFKVFTLSDLYEEELPDTQWVAKDLIPLGGITAVTGESNSFKSFLTLALAASVVSGEPFLGQFPTTQGRVLIVDEENNRGLIRKRFEDLGVKASPDILFMSQEGFRADMEASVEALRLVIEKEKPMLTILDSLIDIHTSDENDAPKMTAVFTALRQRLLTDESAIIVIHHHRKPQQGNPSRPGQSMRGSSGIYAALDAHINVHRKSANDLIVTQDKLRVQKQLEPFKVSLVLTMEGPIAFAYQGEDDSKEEALLEVQSAVSGKLFHAENPMTVKELSKATGESENDVREVLKKLVARKDVTRRTGPHNTGLYSLTITDNSPDNDSDEASSDGLIRPEPGQPD